ncbi:hypothetical protein ABH931_000259 [Streptacidiphilus sp. MAP12-33]
MTADSLTPYPPTEETFPQSARQVTSRQHPEDPIYVHLAKAWHREGRTVPGEPDLEWRRLTRGLHPAPLPAPRDGRLLPGKHRRENGGQQP